MGRWLICGLFAVLAMPVCAQRYRNGPPPVLRAPGARRGGIGTPQLPPGTALNGVPGTTFGPSFNGLPLFSNRTYHFGCYGNCGNAQQRRSSYPAAFGYVPLFNAYSFPSAFDSNDFGPAPPPVDPTAAAITDELNQIHGELNQMRAQSQTAAAPPEPVAPAASNEPPQPPEPATVIVLRDGRRFESTNYAVMDRVLWNFSARPIQKIPLASIDVPASEKANAERGMDFSLSASAAN